MAEEENEVQPAEEKSGGGLMQKLIFAGAGIALLAAGVLGGPIIKNMISPPAEEGEAAEAETPSDKPEIYQSLHPPLVVNFRDSAGESHFMQITMEVMSRDQGVINAVREHTPAIRNELILMLGNTDYDEIVTREGKERMLDDALSEIQGIMQDRIGETGVERVYFTSLIIQ